MLKETVCFLFAVGNQVFVASWAYVLLFIAFKVVSELLKGIEELYEAGARAGLRRRSNGDMYCPSHRSKVHISDGTPTQTSTRFDA